MSIDALIIDDSPTARRIMRHHLEQIGCIVIAEAENATQGVKYFRERRPKIITLDLIMPAVEGVDSMAAFHVIRKEDPNAAIVVVSAVPFERTRQGMSEEGALAYIVKPLSSASFEQARTRLLQAFPELLKL